MRGGAAQADTGQPKDVNTRAALMGEKIERAQTRQVENTVMKEKNLQGKQKTARISKKTEG